MAEQVDKLGTDQQPTGEVIDRDRAHSEGLWHRDVHVWVTDGVRLLQQLRPKPKRPEELRPGELPKVMPDTWDITVAEHVMAGETHLDAAVRGTAEELGREIPRGHFLRMPNGLFASELVIPGWPVPHRTVGDNYMLVMPELSLDMFSPDPTEVAGLRLYGIDQLEYDLQVGAPEPRHAPQPPELWALGIAAMR